MLQTMTRATALFLLLAVTACNGIDTGLNPRPDVRKEQGSLTVPPPGVLRGMSCEPAPVYTPTKPDAGPASLRCVQRANGLESDCQPL